MCRCVASLLLEGTTTLGRVMGLLMARRGTLLACTDLAFKVWTGLRDIARARPDEIATREMRGSA